MHEQIGCAPFTRTCARCTNLCQGTLEEYGRMNPFTEDLFDWHERGRAWTRDDRG